MAPVPVKPEPLPAPTELRPSAPPEPLAIAGKYVVLKDDKLIEGTVRVSGDTVIVRQGALDRPFAKSQVQFVGLNRDEVYKFMLAKAPAADPAARLQVARWCMFSGLREQALAEAQEVLKLNPKDTSAKSMVRSLELSLKEYPPADAPKMTPPVMPTLPAELTTEPIPPMSIPTPGVVPPAPVVPPMTPAVEPVLPPVVPPVAPKANDPLPPVAGPKPAVPPAVDPLLPLPVPTAAPVPQPPVAPLPRPTVTAPALPPAIPPADPLVPALPAAPAPKPVGVPPIPPAGFGTDVAPKLPVTGPAGDEFDPAGFNKPPK